MRKLKNLNWILLIFFLGGVIFYSNSNFVEKHILPKEYVFIFFSLLLGSITLLNNRQSIQLDRLTIIVILSVLYLLFASVFTSPAILGGLVLIGFLFLFFFFRDYSQSYKIINSGIIILCILQAGYGLMQYFHIVRPPSGFPIVGSYDNPAGFAACLAVAFPLAFSLLKYSRPYKLLALSAIIIIGVAVVLSESRAGIISITVVLIVFVYYQLAKKFKNLKKHLFPCLLIAGLCVFIFLLSFKKDSASGRVLIWKVTSAMFQDSPVLGNGSGSFRANYMDYQADYLIQNPESKYALLADNVLHPFNEYLLLLVESGIIGLILLAVCVFLLFRSSKLSSPYLLCLVSLGVFSLFSYPLKYPFTWVIAIYCITQISRNNKPIFTFQFPPKIWFKFLVMIVVIIGLFFLVRGIKFEYNWNKVAKYCLLGKTKEMIPKYEELHRGWNGNYLFLYNYGAELNHIKEYEKSIDIFNQCLLYWNDYDIQMIIANNYFNLSEWIKAEQHYILASNMCPNRFVPLYKLHQLYLDDDRKDEALEMAQKILEKEIKIPSSTVYSIKTEMKKYVGDVN